MTTAPPHGGDLDPAEQLDRQQRAAIRRAANARSMNQFSEYRHAMDEIDRLATERLRLSRG